MTSSGLEPATFRLLPQPTTLPLDPQNTYIKYIKYGLYHGEQILFTTLLKISNVRGNTGKINFRTAYGL
jgi:hypothetical protein